MTRTFVTAAMLCVATPLFAQTGPAPAMTHMPPDVIAQACAPSLAFTKPVLSMLVTGGQDASTRLVFRPGDLVTINAGSENGIEVGQEYFVRRVQAPRGTGISRNSPATIHTTGWVKVYAVEKRMSLVTVTHACDAIDVGDYLEPFGIPIVPAAEITLAKPQRENYARILFGIDRRYSFALRDFFIIDHGSDHGVRVGSRFVVYHDKMVKGNFLYDIGEAVAVEVTPETSTLQVTVARTSMSAGDYVAIRK